MSSPTLALAASGHRMLRRGGESFGLLGVSEIVGMLQSFFAPYDAETLRSVFPCAGFH